MILPNTSMLPDRSLSTAIGTDVSDPIIISD